MAGLPNVDLHYVRCPPQTFTSLHTRWTLRTIVHPCHCFNTWARAPVGQLIMQASLLWKIIPGSAHIMSPNTPTHQSAHLVYPNYIPPKLSACLTPFTTFLHGFPTTCLTRIHQGDSPTSFYSFKFPTWITREPHPPKVHSPRFHVLVFFPWLGVPAFGPPTPWPPLMCLSFLAR